MYPSYRYYQGYNDDPSYTSHAHGWSSGPTSALTYYVLGLTVTAPQGKTWSFAPHTSGLSAAEGGFETPLGWFGAKWWSLSGSGKHQKFTVSLKTPSGTTGVLKLPVVGKVNVNGTNVARSADGLLSLEGGAHEVVVQS